MRAPASKLILEDKGEFTKFKILLEVLKAQPHVRQKDISESLGITVQAVSKYFKRLTREGLLEAGSERADYRLTPKALMKLREDIRGLDKYVSTVKDEVGMEHALPALATIPVKAGDEVGLTVDGGILYAVAPEDPRAEAVGVVADKAEPGEDVGLTGIKGKLRFKHGRILIVKLPSISMGGSRAVDLARVKRIYMEFKPDRIGVMGIVGRAVLNKLGLKADLEFGISRAAALAASRGLNVMVLVVGRMVNRMIEEIDAVNMKNATVVAYEVEDVTISDAE